ncbi:MAG TPA: UvrD-helicase domain-containing protein [Casimicrobiaceae bacterium]
MSGAERVSDMRRESDDAVRAQALDVTRSWLVQAPAGSGKTGLLIQRFLALLAKVDRPERIVAMTFTRKAAAEMRERILRALREAGDDDGDEGVDDRAERESTPHALTTRRLALAARQRIDAEGWNVLEQPSRLRIVTIDALAASLARQAPMSSQLGAMPQVDEQARELYVAAVRGALAAAGASDPAWRRFLDWLDNDVELATERLVDMLGARDRWPAHFLGLDAAALRSVVEAALRAIGERAAAAAAELMPPTFVAALAESARDAAETLHAQAANVLHAQAAGATDRDLVDALSALAHTRRLPAADDRQAWAALCDWLLTKGGGLRKQGAIAQGFAPAGNGSGAVERKRRKAAFKALLDEASLLEGLEGALQRLRDAPPPAFDDAAWEFVAAAVAVLKKSAEALDRVFVRRGAIDFPEQTFRALAALGEADDPGDLLLAIDYRLAHLLVDEFQDTSAAQLALIGRLTAGWEPGDGRTLFAVGDPVQSIYRFRKAEVGLFIAAQNDGEIAGVPVEVAALTRNFRSAPAIVSWVNAVFGDALPARSDGCGGNVAYAPAQAAATLEGGAPSLDLVPSRGDEAKVVVERVRAALAAGDEKVAVLLRARSHARSLLPALRSAGIDYSAVELESVHNRLATRDLLMLVRALSQPADRLAWFSVLRAPWCGLALADLLAVAEAAPSGAAPDALVTAISDPARITRLSDDGRARITRLADALHPVLEMRGRTALALRARAAWLALGGPACADAALDLDGAERVFALVDRHARAGDLDDYDALAAEAATLFAESAETGPGTVQLMTIHKAKGLEFDTVILPGLDCGVGRGSPPVLRWNAVGPVGERALVVAPHRRRAGASRDDDPIYAWLAGEDASEERAELTRLVYVGVTRAKRRLHLVGVANAVSQPEHGDVAWKRPKAGSALGRIWTSVERVGALPPPLIAADPGDPNAPTAPATPAASDATAASEPDPLQRLALDWQRPALAPPLPAPAMAEATGERVPFEWADVTAAAVGTVTHRLLAQIAREGLARWDDTRLRREMPRVLAELAGEGVDADQRERASRQVAAAIAHTLSDERGRWILSAENADAHSEWALAGYDEGSVVHVVLDRSFVADGVRYIVDFKTGRHEGGDRATFLASELDRYRPQLLRYARILRALEPRPIRIALYHPLVDGGWQEEMG